MKDPHIIHVMRKVSGEDKIEFHIRNGTIGGKYFLTQADGTDFPRPLTRDYHVICLGGGGFGVVVKAKDRLGISRAIKLLVYGHRTELDAETESSKLFQEEILLGNARPFKHVVPVIDYGADKDDSDKPFRYYVSPFVDGFTLRTYCNNLRRSWSQVNTSEIFKNRARDQILSVMLDILSGIVEMHEARIVHMDVKPDNIMVFPKAVNPLGIGPAHEENLNRFTVVTPAKLQGFVIDLGAGKSVEDNHTGRTLCIHTPEYFPKYLRDDYEQINYKEDEDGVPYCNYEKLKDHWRQIDIHCCGRTFEWVLLDRARLGTWPPDGGPDFARREAEKESFWQEVFGDDFAVIAAIINRMVSEHSDRRYHSVDEAKAALDTIPLTTSKSILASEALTDRRPGIKIRTGASLVKVSVPFDRIVDHPSFQRLRLRQQLAFVSEIYPGGTHTRFSHSLRTFHLAKAFVMALNKRSIFRFLFERKDVEHLLAAALLHDIGQYPFAHTIEDLRKIGTLCKDENLAQISHDQERVEEMINMEDEAKVTISDIMRDHDLDPEKVLYIIDKRKKIGKKGEVLNVSRDLVSGIIDVDRVSYLTQDSELTGVPFGTGIDVGQLIESLTIKLDPMSDKSQNAALAIEESGVTAAEAVLTAVYWMYRNVYWHHMNRAFMAAVKFVMGWMIRKDYITFNKYHHDTLTFSDWEALNYLNRNFDEWLKETGRNWVNPLSSLINFKRIGYRRVSSLRKEGEFGEELFHTLEYGISPSREDDLLRDISARVQHAKPLPGDVLIDIPLKGRLAKDQETLKEAGRSEPLYVCCRWPFRKDFSGWVRMEDYSPLAKTLSSAEAYSGRKIRVFFSRSLCSRLSPSEMKEAEREMPNWLAKATNEWGKSLEGIRAEIVSPEGTVKI